MGKVAYQIITTIKESKKGNVYLATVEGYGFPVIVKKLKHGNRDVFEALKTIQNEHFPQIYRVEETDDGLLVVEEYIEGELLADYPTVKKITESEYIGIAKQLCAALRVLHEHIPPLIHRDVKPSNVIVNSKGVIKLIDFDSSRVYKEESDGDTRLLGTEKYAAPEQYGFSQTDCRSDIYSLGVVFGMFPEFTSEAKKKRWKKLVEKCTLFAPESRYQTVAEVERELQKVEKAGGIPWVKIAAVAGVLLLLCGAGVLLKDFAKSREAGSGSDAVLTSTPQPQQERELTPMPTPEPTQELMPSTTPEPTQESMPSPTPEPTPSPSPIPTAEPEPTPSLSLTPEPTQAPMPSPTPTPATLPEESYRTTKPEWRDVETDPEAYVELKERIRNLNLVVMYCFKDRLGEKDYLIQVKELERPGAELLGVRLHSYETNREFMIEERFIELRDNVIHIDGAYMKSLAEGYYKIGTELRRAEETGAIESGVMLYVGESDILEEPDWWLQNTTFTYHGDEEETLNVVLKNDSGRELLKLLSENKEEVGASLYRLHCDGRAMELSDELLRRDCTGSETWFWVMCTDGSTIQIRIDKSEPQ